VQHHVHESQAFGPILSQIRRIHFNIIFPPTPRTPKWSLFPSGLPTKRLRAFSLFPYVLQVLSISSFRYKAESKVFPVLKHHAMNIYLGEWRYSSTHS